jgi:DNA-binding beta-propeller fold protein YncE
MKAWLFGFLLLLAAAPAWAQEVTEIPFDSVPNAVRMPQNMYLGEVAGVAVNSKKHIFVFSRGNTTGPNFGAAASQLLEFAPDGKLVREIGKNLYAFGFAHTVRVDKDDNVWTVDKGTDMIVKFDREGRVQMVFGRRQEASDEAAPHKRTGPPPKHEDGRFRQPTDVTWDAAGNSYFSDGYVNSRIAKVDKTGRWIKTWGERGEKPGEFNTPHTIASDAQGNIYVGDRGNGRIQVFDSDGKFLREIWIKVPFDRNTVRPAIGNIPAEDVKGTQAPGAPWAICITPGPRQVLYSADAYPGRIYKMTLEGKILGVLGESGKQLKQLGWVHEMACPSENEIYVAEVLNWRVQKLILKPGQQMSVR